LTSFSKTFPAQLLQEAGHWHFGRSSLIANPFAFKIVPRDERRPIYLGQIAKAILITVERCSGA
jgi:hypothetical protein